MYDIEEEEAKMDLIGRGRRGTENSCILKDINWKTRTVLRRVAICKDVQLRDKVIADTIKEKCCPPKTRPKQD